MIAAKLKSTNVARRVMGLAVLSGATLAMWAASPVWAGNPANLLFPPGGGALLVPFSADGPQGNGPAGISDPLQRNDDDFAQASFGMPGVPFVFNLYGMPYTGNQVFVNNNGNLSFGAGFSTFTSSGFPVANFPMVAPFWADVDTRALGSGVAYYEYLDTNAPPGIDTLVVTWDNVGYFGNHDDKLNTFQVAISNGTNPRMGIGNNVCFSYDDMVWTTGDASSGVGGFGGVPATVGVNAGNGVNFFQIGRFDHAGVDYDGSGGANDGVSFLDNLDTCFSTIAGQNQPPIAIGFPGSGEIILNPVLGQFLNANFQFIGPELLDAVTITAVNDFDGAFGLGLVSNTLNGDPALASLQWSNAALLPLVGNSYDLRYDFQDSFGAMVQQNLRITLVPEPSSFVLAALAMGAVGFRSLRRRTA